MSNFKNRFNRGLNVDYETYLVKVKLKFYRR